jgi:hypothetical protein
MRYAFYNFLEIVLMWSTLCTARYIEHISAKGLSKNDSSKLFRKQNVRNNLLDLMAKRTKIFFKYERKQILEAESICL